MVQMDDTNPCVSSPKLSAGLELQFSGQLASWTAKLWLRQGCPGMEHREEEHDGKAIGSVSSMGTEPQIRTPEK